MTIDVLVELKAKSIDKTFTYKVPDHLKESIMVGIRVLVPFSNKKLEGFVMAINNTNSYDYELKEIDSIIDSKPILNSEMLELGKYMSKKTLSTLISCYQTMLPTALKAKQGFSISKKYISYLVMNNDTNVKGDKQKVIIDLIKTNNKILKSEANDISISSVKSLLDKGIIKELKEEVYRINDDDIKEDKKIILNDDQQLVVNTVLKDKDKFIPYLLYGVTGSGKTEVYMHIIEKVISDGKEAIVLVPEISLTPQLVDVFKKRFGSIVAILHSGLSNGEKYDEWRKIEEKKVSIVIGARSAIFAPLTNIGVIIIDEEHSQTYKQDNNPRYNAIDIALYRAKNYNVPIILGSATPSIESYTRAKANIYKLLVLKSRINNNMPKVNIVDMKEDMKNGSRYLSNQLIEKIEDRLQKKEQIIILLNRRGYTTITTCHNCGYTLKCPKCDIPLVYHKTSNLMRCHYCGYNKSKLIKCPNCNSEDINDFGFGTEKLEEELNKLFNCRIVRMDYDSTSTKGSHERIINDFKNLEYDILIGTQIVAKGLDFPKVTLVGVVNGDSSLNIPNYQSGERTFQLLNQVAGRSGRGELLGEVIIQTFNPDHYSIIKASNHDYAGFYEIEMNIRKTLKYPPYYNLLLLKMSSKNLENLTKESNKIAEYLRKKVIDAIILGPSMATMPKLNNTYYMQIIVKYKNTSNIITDIKFVIDKYRSNNKMNVDIDFNPN